MNKIAIEIGQALAGKLLGFKFVKSKSWLIKKETDGWKAITIDVLPSSESSVVKLAAHALIRLDELEVIYTQYHPFVNGKDTKDHATLSVNCDQLLSNKSLANGFSVDSESVASFIQQYGVALEEDVLPFLERYYSEAVLFESFYDSNPRNWVTSDRITRNIVLLAISVHQQNKEVFEQVAKEFTEYCEKPHAKVYKPLADSVIAGLSSWFS